MSEKKVAPAPGDRVVIGLTFGNSNSSIAHTVDDKAEVIANEDGGRSGGVAKFDMTQDCLQVTL
jgi:molecular chaperone DnaK (HSP70)